jgi:hypothetical protein
MLCTNIGANSRKVLHGTDQRVGKEVSRRPSEDKHQVPRPQTLHTRLKEIPFSRHLDEVTLLGMTDPIS